MAYNSTPHPERFWRQVEDEETSEGCWRWMGAKTPQGYGYYSLNGVQRPAHVVAYELLVGPVPEGKELAHYCHNPSCVRPDEKHARPLTHRENMLEGPTNAAGKAAKVTHCPASHPYDDANTRKAKDGSRHCRACHRSAQARRRQRRKENAGCRTE